MPEYPSGQHRLPATVACRKAAFAVAFEGVSYSNRRGDEEARRKQFAITQEVYKETRPELRKTTSV
jgi:hypothetical protein